MGILLTRYVKTAPKCEDKYDGSAYATSQSGWCLVYINTRLQGAKLM